MRAGKVSAPSARSGVDRRTGRGERWPLVVCAAASLVIVAPVLGGLGTATFAGPDGASFVWSFWWMKESVEALRWPLSSTHIFWPVGTPLAFHTGMPALALMTVPLQLLIGATSAYNVVVALTPLASTMAMYALARDTGLEPPDSAVAGLAFGTAPVLIDRLAIEHLNLAFAAWMPLALLLLRRTLREDRWQPSALLGAVLALSLGTDVTIFIFTVLLLLGYAAWWAWRSRHQLEQVVVGARSLLPGVAVFALLSAPLAAAMARAILAGDYLRLNGLGGALTYSADLAGFLRPPERSLWGGRLSGAVGPLMDGRPVDGTTYLGGVALALAIVGALAVRGTARHRPVHRWAIGVVAAGCLLAVGPVLHVLGNPLAIITIPGPDGDGRVSLLLPFTWLNRLPLLEGLRSPGRFVTITALGLALLAGVGTAELRRRWPRIPAHVAVTVLAALLVADAAVHFDALVPIDVPSAVHVIAESDDGAVVNVPLSLRSGSHLIGALDGSALLWGTVHGKPVASGFGARTASWRLEELAEEPFYAAVLALQEGRTRDLPATSSSRASREELDVRYVTVESGFGDVGSYLRTLGFDEVAGDADDVTLYTWRDEE